MIAELKKICEDFGLSFLVASDEEANILKDFSNYPTLIFRLQSIRPENVNALTYLGSSQDIYNVSIKIFVKGNPLYNEEQHTETYLQAQDLSKKVLYALTKFDGFLKYLSVSTIFVKNKYDSYANGCELQLSLLWRRNLNIDCYVPL